MKNSTCSSCNCHTTAKKPYDASKSAVSKFRQGIESVGSVGLSLLIAFFPKCPLCLAAYMSMLGSIGLSYSQYAGWILPILVVFLGLHLWSMFKKGSQKGYLPFAFSLTGAVLMLAERSLQLNQQWLLLTSVVLIFGGSLLNNFSATRVSEQAAAFKQFFLNKFQIN
jgi:mercuric ion transport protein